MFTKLWMYLLSFRMKRMKIYDLWLKMPYTFVPTQ